MSSLILGDLEKREKIFNVIEKYQTKLSVLLYVTGFAWLFVLPYQDYVHRTYMSENALSPGLVRSDIYENEGLLKMYDHLKVLHEKQEFNVDSIGSIFNSFAIETFYQNFNISSSLYQESVSNRNVYAIVRALRTPNTESIVITAPLYTDFNDLDVPNLFGIAQLLYFSNLAKKNSYWAKDLIFVITNNRHIGIEAWLNSYFNVQPQTYLKSENLVARGGSIQAALNIEMHDIKMDKLHLKLEGSNGQMPNLDLFNTIIRICRDQQLKCGLENMQTFDQFENYKSSFENVLSMILRQATGVPSSQHGYFLKHHIEAITIKGVLTTKSIGLKAYRQNTLKSMRIIEGTLRSINNLLERFHQSFFFYLLANENSYISIGNYMPPLGFILAPLLIQILCLWIEIHKKQSEYQNRSIKLDLIKSVLPDIACALGIMLANYICILCIMSQNLSFAIMPKECLLVSHGVCLIVSLTIPLFIRNRQVIIHSSKDQKSSTEIQEAHQYVRAIDLMTWKILKFIATISLATFLGSLSIINYSLALIISILYVPICLTLTRSECFTRALPQMLLTLLICPFVLLTGLYFAYSRVYSDYFYDRFLKNFYHIYALSKISNIWTYDLVCLGLFPIWLLFWALVIPRK